MTSSTLTSQASKRRSRFARARVLVFALVVVAALAVLASGCGGSSAEGVANVSTTDTATTTGADSRSGSSGPSTTAYSECMRKNGVPKFPDPDSQGHLAIQGGAGLDPSSPQFKAAEKVCGRLLPRRGEEAPTAEERQQGMQEA